VEKLSLLIVEDSPLDGALVLRELRRNGIAFSHEVVETASDFDRALATGTWDAVLSDFNVPSFGAIPALKCLRDKGIDIPLLVISGAIGEENAVELMKAGAEDLITKNNLHRLVPSLLRSLREKQLRLREEEAKAAATRAIKDRENMVALVSHDLKSPLSGLRLNLDALSARISREANKDQFEKHLRRMRNSLDRMQGLVSNVLDFSKIEGGTFSIQKERTVVGGVISDVVEEFQEQLRSKSIELKVSIPPTPVLASFDRTRLFQVFANLLGNAIKFTGPGGKIEIGANPTSDGVTFLVRDTGMGISQSDLPLVFNRLYQAREASPLGTGLGLFIAKSIVDAHNGRIWVESELGKGTTFYFYLPDEISKSAGAELANASGRTVLVVDDDSSNREIIAELLAEAGHRVITATQGREGLALLENLNEKLDAIIVDSRMPVMGGVELARRVKQLNGDLSRTPIILTSADPVAADESHLFEAFLPKPIRFPQLLTLVAQVAPPHIS